MTTLADFEAWPKIPRLRRDILITEKIDGSNGQISIRPAGSGDYDALTDMIVEDEDGDRWLVRCGSRNRWLGEGQDNFGFRAWVDANARQLVTTLGEGRHFGEWYGSGIQRGYGLDQRYFALFNAYRWREIDSHDPLGSPVAEPIVDFGHDIGLTVVPILYVGPWSEGWINAALDLLREGSTVWDPQRADVPAEGVVVYHRASNSSYKVLLENDHISKTEAGVA